MNSQNDPQDHKNLLFAIILSLAVLVGWQYFFAAPKLREEQARKEYSKELEAQRNGDQKGLPGVTTAPVTPPAAANAPTADTQPALAPMSRDEALKGTPRLAIKTPSLEGSIALQGGRIDDLVLVKYRETVDPNSAMVTLLSPAGGPNPYFAEYGWVAQSGSTVKVPDRDTVWAIEKGDALTPEAPVTLTWDNGEGLVFRRTISVDKDYMFKVVDEVENKTTAEVALLPYARVHRVGTPKSAAFYILHEGLIGVSGEEGLQEVTYANAVKEDIPKKIENVTGGWLGITDKYWAATLIPDQKEPYRATYSATKPTTPNGLDAYQVDYLRGAVTIPPNARKGIEGHLYAGAKQATLIDTYETSLGILNFDRMIDWGWFYFITKPLFHLMEIINGIVHNFGVTILILTVLVKAAFYPLANKQYTSMARMKRLQPEVARIKELYKDDPQRQQKETFELYRKEKINPLAGCWPIFLQIPVFFALYKVLFVTIDMRHAPFFGWIKDLSAPDPTSLFNLFGLLSYAPPDFLHIGVWPLIMGVTMWVQMQLNPPQPDPIQQQVFAWMPVMFTFLLASFPAGLVIYWAWSNFLSIIQQWRINKKNGAEIHLMSNVKRTFGPDSGS
ncbi:MAG: membrane protein insertase YidC [Hyphomicrobium sp.]|nr:membrane protein insertase YidC [Hyphomicrobium sp.]